MIITIVIATEKSPVDAKEISNDDTIIPPIVWKETFYISPTSNMTDQKPNFAVIESMQLFFQTNE